MTDFTNTVLSVVRSIPKGSTLSYQEVALQAGKARAYRRVATIMANNFDPTVPCHRVIKSDGTLGGYNRGGTSVKRELLLSEGAIL